MFSWKSLEVVGIESRTCWSCFNSSRYFQDHCHGPASFTTLGSILTIDSCLTGRRFICFFRLLGSRSIFCSPLKFSWLDRASVRVGERQWGSVSVGCPTTRPFQESSFWDNKSSPFLGGQHGFKSWVQILQRMGYYINHPNILHDRSVLKTGPSHIFISNTPCM